MEQISRVLQCQTRCHIARCVDRNAVPAGVARLQCTAVQPPDVVADIVAEVPDRNQPRFENLPENLTKHLLLILEREIYLPVPLDPPVIGAHHGNEPTGSSEAEDVHHIALIQLAHDASQVFGMREVTEQLDSGENARQLIGSSDPSVPIPI